MYAKFSSAILLDISQNAKYFVQKLADPFHVFLLFILMHYLSAIESIKKKKQTKHYKNIVKNHTFKRCSSWRWELMTFETVKIHALYTRYN